MKDVILDCNTDFEDYLSFSFEWEEEHFLKDNRRFINLTNSTHTKECFLQYQKLRKQRRWYSHIFPLDDLPLWMEPKSFRLISGYLRQQSNESDSKGYWKNIHLWRDVCGFIPFCQSQIIDKKNFQHIDPQNIFHWWGDWQSVHRNLLQNKVFFYLWFFSFCQSQMNWQPEYEGCLSEMTKVFKDLYFIYQSMFLFKENQTYPLNVWTSIIESFFNKSLLHQFFFSNSSHSLDSVFNEENFFFARKGYSSYGKSHVRIKGNLDKINDQLNRKNMWVINSYHNRVLDFSLTQFLTNGPIYLSWNQTNLNGQYLSSTVHNDGLFDGWEKAIKLHLQNKIFHSGEWIYSFFDFSEYQKLFNTIRSFCNVELSSDHLLDARNINSEFSRHNFPISLDGYFYKDFQSQENHFTLYPVCELNLRKSMSQILQCYSLYLKNIENKAFTIENMHLHLHIRKDSYAQSMNSQRTHFSNVHNQVDLSHPDSLFILQLFHQKS